jgi:tetratricopeptide (TPR) repeat protein
MTFLRFALASMIVPLAVGAGSPASAQSRDRVVGNATGSYLSGRAAQQRRDYATAAQFFEKALQQSPGEYDLLVRTFRLEIGEGRMDRALDYARKVIAIDKKEPFANLLLSFERVKGGDFAAAADEASDLPEEGIHRLATPLVQAWIQAGLGQPAAAIKELDPLGEMRGLSTLKDLHTALIADFAGRTQEAESWYEAVLKGSARLTWRVVDLTGNFYERTGRTEDAKKLYERFVSESGGSEQAESALQRVADAKEPPLRRVGTPLVGLAEALFDLASLLNQQETIDLGLAYGRLALYLKPDLALAQLVVADILDTLRRPQQALEMNRSIDLKSPYAWSARLRAAANLETLEKTDEAVAELRAMAAERPTRSQALVQLGDLFRGKQRYAESAEAYEEAIARIGTVEQRHWSLFYSRGIAYERADKWDKAEPSLQKALELQPDQPLVLNYLGYSWVDKGLRLDDAFKMIEKAVQLRPNDGYIVDSLGWAHYRLGHYEEATKHLERAVELRPQDPTINDHLGDAYWRLGRKNEARSQWERALLFKPEPDEVAPIQKKLENGLDPAPQQAQPTPSKGGG